MIPKDGTISATLQEAWEERAKLYAKGHKHCVEGCKFYAEGDKLYAEGKRLSQAEGERLHVKRHWLYAKGRKHRAERDRLYAEGDIHFLTTVIAEKGNIGVTWKWEWDPAKREMWCVLATGEVFEPITEGK